jgi:hypothetical protein
VTARCAALIGPLSPIDAVNLRTGGIHSLNMSLLGLNMREAITSSFIDC